MDQREIELKLRVEDDTFWDRYTKDPYLLSLAGSAAPVSFLADNLYFDTASGGLRRAGLALRVRISRGCMEATVKDQGSSQGGLHTRNEWTVPVSSAEAPDPKVFEVLDPGIAGRLRTAAGTDMMQKVVHITFTRARWMLALPGGGLAEMAADKGIIRAGGYSIPLAEVELELKSGDPKALSHIGEELCRRYRLLPEDRSKYARGLELADQAGQNGPDPKTPEMG